MPGVKRGWGRHPWWHRRLESACQCRGHRLDPWSRKIPRAARTTKQVHHYYGSFRACSSTSVLPPLKPEGLRSTTGEATAMRGLLQHRMPASHVAHCHVSDSIELGKSLRICTLNRLLWDVDSANLENTLRKLLGCRTPN